MEFDQMLPTLHSQASRIFNGDRDSMQDALAMSFVNYNSCLDRNGRQLSIGELTNFIKHRATELNNGKRPQFGNISTKRTNDVYFKRNYLRGDVEILSFDYEDFENSKDDRGMIAYQTRIPSLACNRICLRNRELKSPHRGGQKRELRDEFRNWLIKNAAA